MKITYSDFGKSETKSRMSKWNIDMKEVNKTKTETGTGFVFAKTRDLRSTSILRWETAMRPESIKFNTTVSKEPEKYQNALKNSLSSHDNSNEVVVDFCFYIDPQENSDVDWPNKHVISICSWKKHKNVVTGEEMLNAIKWAIKSV